MKKQFTIIVIFLLILTVGLSGCLGPASKNFKNEYDSNENTILNIKNINGKIEITNWNGDKIALDAKISSWKGQTELDKLDIQVDESNNKINIETKYLGQGSVDITTDMTIKVPTFITVDNITTSNGDVQISDTNGNITAHSLNGAIKIEDVTGYIEAITSNGQIEIKDTTGIRNLHSSIGDIYTEIYAFKDNITISTSNGGIVVYINPLLNANISMTTSNGNVYISDISLDLTISQDKKKSGKLGEGGNSIIISTSNGNINLYKLNV